MVNQAPMQKNIDVKYYNLCRDVMEAKSGVLEKLRPMLVLPQDEAEAMCTEMKELFLRLMKQTKFYPLMKEIVIAGSLREKLKAGHVDELDVQIRFEQSQVEKMPSQRELFWQEAETLNRKMEASLAKSLAKISWEGIHLRPISIHHPWKFIREGNGVYQGLVIFVDIILILIDEYKERQHEKNPLESAPNHNIMYYMRLGNDHSAKFDSTSFAIEWDIIDSLPTNMRLAILMAKALVQSYHWCRGDRLQVKMPITSYVIKIAVFYILLGDYHLIPRGNPREVMKAVVPVRKDPTVPWSMQRRQTLRFSPNPKWADDNDVDQFAEEARIVACQIFTFIIYMTFLGEKMEDYWNLSSMRSTHRFNWQLGEAEYMNKICCYCLRLLEKDKFYE